MPGNQTEVGRLRYFYAFPVLLCIGLAVLALPPALRTGVAEPSVGAHSVWVADHHAVHRIDPTTHGILQTVPLPDEPGAIAVGADDQSLWVLAHKRLLKFDASTSLVAEIDLKDVMKNVEEARLLAIDPYDGSLWVGAKKDLLRLNRQGEVLQQRRLDDKLEALVVHADGSLFVLTEKEILQLGPEGAVINSARLKGLGIDEPAHLALDALGERLWLADRNDLYQVLLPNLNCASIRIPLNDGHHGKEHHKKKGGHDDDEHHDEDEDREGKRGSVEALAIDPVTGTVWVATRDGVRAFDRSGIDISNFPLPRDLKEIETFVFDAVDQTLWVADHRALLHLALDGGERGRIDVREMEAMALPPFQLLPQLSLLRPVAGAISNNPHQPIELQLSALCNSRACEPGTQYTQQFTLDVTLNGAATGPLFTIAGPIATFVPVERLPEGGNTLSARIIDRFGRATPVIAGEFTIDTIPPQITVETPGAPVTRIPAQTLTGVVSEPVSFAIDGQPHLLDAANRFSHPLTLKEGINEIILTATDAAGNRTERTLAVTLDTVPPSFTSLTPADGAAFSAPIVNIQGGVDDPTATIVLPDLDALAGEVISADPRAFNFRIALRPGQNTITVLAQDPAGNVRTAALNLALASGSVRVTNLTDGASVSGDRTLIVGTFEGPANTGVTVNGVVAEIFDNHFYVNDVPLASGENQITVVASTLHGEVGTHILTINSGGSSAYTLERIPHPFSTVQTIAGTGETDSSGDGGPALQAKIGWPSAVAVGPDGSVYVADGASSTIRRIDPDGIITTIAGNGEYGYSGDGGPATEAKLDWIEGLEVGSDGSIYIADYSAWRVRRVGPDGIISTVAGNGQEPTGGADGDGGPAVLARIVPSGIALGPDGSLYLTDNWHGRIRRVGPDGIITTIAGTGQRGYSGDGGPATSAQLHYPEDVAVAADGSIYIADASNSRIRRVTTDGIINTVAGNGEDGIGGDGGPALDAQVTPHRIEVAPDGTLYVLDYFDRIRRIDKNGMIRAVAGTGQESYGGDGGPPLQATFNYPNDIALSTDGLVVYVADMENHRIRAFSVHDAVGDQASLSVTFKLNAMTSRGVRNVEVDFDGDGTTDFTTTNQQAVFQYRYPSPGAYVISARVTDDQDEEHIISYALVLQHESHMDTIATELWSGMNEALVAGDIGAAAKYVNKSGRRKYQPIFEALKEHMPEIVASYSPLRRLSTSASIGEYAITRTVNGQTKVFLIYFLKDSDGVWRLDSM